MTIRAPGGAAGCLRSAAAGARACGARTDFLPLTPGVLKGQVHIGRYPLLDGDRCWWLAADFDGPDALPPRYSRVGTASC